MTGSFLGRVQRIITSGADTVLTKAEQLSGGGLMRSAIRDLEATIARSEAAADEARARRAHVEHQMRDAKEQLASLKEQASFALAKGREDLARSALASQIAIEAAAGRLKQAQSDSAKEESRLSETIRTLQVRRDQMQKEYESFETARNAAAAGPAERAERSAARSRELFDRAAAAIGTVGPRLQPDQSEKVEAILELRQEEEIERRLAELRTPTDQPATAKPARARSTRRPRSA